MLFYLDNWLSVAPGSGAEGPNPQVRRNGLNENYARELMELHTLGVDAGYSQKDVTELARMLTGWTLGPLGQRGADDERPWQPPGDPRRMPGFRFNARMHDDGEKTWLGHRIAPAGMAEGEFALETLARHPATARHIAFQLAQYFVSDQPDPALVQRMADVFQAQDGQLVPVLRTLFTSADFWAPAQVGAKFKTPTHYAYSVLRATGQVPANVQPVVQYLAGEGMPLFGCQTPDGYKNTEAAWLSPNTMARRIEFATRVGKGQLTGDDGAAIDPQQVLASLGPLVTPATRTVVAENSDDAGLATALALAGPGMMRR
jgi:uncharacterized protein (DUF1800 family)